MRAGIVKRVLAHRNVALRACNAGTRRFLRRRVVRALRNNGLCGSSGS